MPVFTDQTGRIVSVASAERIVSIVPSQTELLYDLGLGDRVAGITKFCVHPEEWFRSKIRVGGTKQLNTGIIRKLQPDLIIANKEENRKEEVEELALHYPVWISDIHNLDEACEMIRQIGHITGTDLKAKEMVARILENFRCLQTPAYAKASAGKPDTRTNSNREKTHDSRLTIHDSRQRLSTGGQARLKTAYLIWQKPYMTAGGDTFIHSMLEAAGFENIFAGRSRYPETGIEELRDNGCECLLLSSEPFPFRQKHIEELQRLLPGTKILLVDGEMFSWYGSRLLQAPHYFNSLREQL